MHMSVPSVPPEAVNMSLGLSLAASTNPSQLLVSCLGLWSCPEGRTEDLGLGGGGFGDRGLGEGEDTGVGGWVGSRSSSSHQVSLSLGLWPHSAPYMQGECVLVWILLPAGLPFLASPEAPGCPAG